MRRTPLVHWMAASALCFWTGAATAAPVVFTQAVSVVNVADHTANFTVIFSDAFVGMGNYNLKLSMAGSFADGARDGATVGAIAPSGQLTEFSFVTGSGTQALGGVGAAATLAGAAGTAGAVQLTAFVFKDFGAPTSFSTSNTSAPLSVGGGTAQGAVAAVGADGGTDGVELGPSAGNALANFGFVRAGDTQDLFDVHGSDASPGPYASVEASGSEFFDCATAPACTRQQTALNLQMAGGEDAAGIVMRQEFGGDPLADINAVIDLIDEQTFLTSFSCAAAGGCTALQTQLSFSVTAGDVLAFVIRAEIDDATSLPEPGGLFALLAASAAAGLARRRPHG